MIEFGGIYYYIDINAFDKAVTSPNKTNKEDKQTETKTVTDDKGNVIGTEINTISREKDKEIETAKYDVLRLMLEVLIEHGNDEDNDTTLGADRALEKNSLSYKIAFNTLYNYGILKEKE
jgi:hypothetical protein